MNDQHRFNVGRDAPCANRVEVALCEFSEATVLSVLAAPHRRDVIPFEWRPQLLMMLRYKAGEWHR